MDKQQQEMKSTRNYWKSLDEKYQTDEFLQQAEKEFQSSPLQAEDDKSGLARRQFMKLMGASIALSGAACVRRPVQKILLTELQSGPTYRRPPGVETHLANTLAEQLLACLNT